MLRSCVAAVIAAAALVGCATNGDEAEGPTGGGGGKADDPSQPFLAKLPGWGRYILLDKLDEVLPAYLAQTRAVLARIDALTPTVADSTKLDEVPIPDLFASGQDVLIAVLDEADFIGGRSDHDVAWLRESATGLAAMHAAVEQLSADGTSPASFNAHLTNESYWSGPDGAVEINVGIAAVSRFYCNLDIAIADGSQGFSVTAIESCD